MNNKEKLTEATIKALEGKLQEDNSVTQKNGYNLIGDVDGYKITKNGKLVKSFGRVDKQTALADFDEFIDDNLESKQKTMADKFTPTIDIHIDLSKLGENFTDNAKQVLRDLLNDLDNTTGLIGGRKDLKYQNKIVGHYNCDILS